MQANRKSTSASFFPYIWFELRQTVKHVNICWNSSDTALVNSQQTLTLFVMSLLFWYLMAYIPTWIPFNELLQAKLQFSWGKSVKYSIKFNHQFFFINYSRLGPSQRQMSWNRFTICGKKNFNNSQSSHNWLKQMTLINTLFTIDH